MSLDLSISAQLLLALLPELVLTGWALVLLLFVAWRHHTVRDLRITGWLTVAALVSAARRARRDDRGGRRPVGD